MKNVSVVTTDGISASWHHKQDHYSLSVRGSEAKKYPREEELNHKFKQVHAHIDGPGFFGKVGDDCILVSGPSMTVIGIDVMLILLMLQYEATSLTMNHQTKWNGLV